VNLRASDLIYDDDVIIVIIIIIKLTPVSIRNGIDVSTVLLVNVCKH
jgi:hypothetical protein